MLTIRLLKGLEQIEGVKVFGVRDAQRQIANLSIGLEHASISDLGDRLDREFGIMVRVGLHCAPLAHKTIGTFPEGTLRLSMGFFNNPTEVEEVIAAIKRCLSG